MSSSKSSLFVVSLSKRPKSLFPFVLLLFFCAPHFFYFESGPLSTASSLTMTFSSAGFLLVPLERSGCWTPWLSSVYCLDPTEWNTLGLKITSLAARSNLELILTSYEGAREGSRVPSWASDSRLACMHPEIFRQVAPGHDLVKP